MIREKLIQKAISKLSKLPDHELEEVSDFAEFLLKKIEDKELTEGIKELASESKSFKFLEEDEELYKTTDLKEKYNEKG